MVPDRGGQMAETVDVSRARVSSATRTADRVTSSALARHLVGRSAERCLAVLVATERV